MKNIQKIKTSIVVRTKDNEDILEETLSAIITQKNIDMELIVIDSGSTDSTLEIASKFNARIVHYKDVYIPGKVINEAISECSNEFVTFINSDTICLSPDSINNLLIPLQDESVGATFGRQVVRPEAEPWVIKDYLNAFPDSNNKPDWMLISLPLASLKKSIWNQKQFYSDAYASEDTEWAKWVIENTGKKIVYIPDSIAMHSHNYTNHQLYNRRYNNGEADFFIFNTKENIKDLLSSYIKKCLSEFVYYLKNKELIRIFKIPFRNIAFSLGYYLGNKNAQRRFKKGDTKVKIMDERVG